MQQAKVLKAPQSDTLWGPQELGGAEVRGREGRGAVAAKGLLQGGAISSAEMMTPPPPTKSYEVRSPGRATPSRCCLGTPGISLFCLSVFPPSGTILCLEKYCNIWAFFQKSRNDAQKGAVFLSQRQSFLL